MKKIRMIMWTVAGVLAAAAPVLAQAADAGKEGSLVYGYKAIAAGIGFGVAAGLAGLGQAKVAAAAAEGAARNPGASNKIQTIMILGLALIESLVLFMLLVVFVKL